MTIDLQVANIQQQISQLTLKLADLKEQHAHFEDQQNQTNADVKQRIDILSLALAEQYEQILAVTEQGMTIMGALAELYEEIMVYEELVEGV